MACAIAAGQALSLHRSGVKVSGSMTAAGTRAPHPWRASISTRVLSPAELPIGIVMTCTHPSTGLLYGCPLTGAEQQHPDGAC